MKLRVPDRQTIGAVVLLLAVLPFVIYAVPQVAGATNSYVVLSDSMSPTIQAGDVVVVDDVPTKRIDEGDVITFDRPGGEEQLVTHRVVEVLQENGQTKFRTKGDANEEPDAQLVPASAVVGVVQFHIPLIGHVISFASSDLGIVAFVIVPAVLLAVNEVYSLYVEATSDGSGAAEDGAEEAAGEDDQAQAQTTPESDADTAESDEPFEWGDDHDQAESERPAGRESGTGGED